ncbi:MAG: hypothetical protein ABIW76_18790 [Fibrobacteria bacterium]
MNPEDLATLKKASAGVEKSLDVFESWLESTNNLSLYQASLSIIGALRHLYAASPELLCAANRTRVEVILEKEKAKIKSGDRFNTGF